MNSQQKYIPMHVDYLHQMDRKSRAIVFGWVWTGAIFVSAAILNAYLNLHSVPPLMEGPIYGILALGLVGGAFIAIGLRAYARFARA